MRPHVEVVGGVGLVAVDERLRALDVARLTAVAIVAVAALAGVGSLPSLLGLSAGYAAAVLVARWRRLPLAGRPSAAVGWLLILDGCYLFLAMAATGGLGSPLRHLVVAHVVAVALLASTRTCGKLLVWHSLLLMIAAAAHASGVWPFAEATYPVRERVAFTAGMWLVGATTCAAAGLNERVLRRARADIEMLAQAMTAVEGKDDAAAVAHALVDSAAATYGFRRALLVDARRHTVLAATGAPSAGVGVKAGPGRALAAVGTAGRPILLDRLDPVGDGRLAGLLPEARNLVIVPLLDEDRPIATLVLEHAAARIDARTLELVRRLAAHGALALGRAHLVELLRGRADRDGLTDVANRGALDRRLQELVTEAIAAGQPLGLLLIDIDHFKQLNDTHGHLAGDAVLQAVARSLMHESRPGDFVARYGGEEFAVVLPDAGPVEAQAVAERLRLGVAGLTGGAAAVTVSIGRACLPQDAGDVAGLLAVADAALYAAKDAGRNRVGCPQDIPAGKRPPAAV